MPPPASRFGGFLFDSPRLLLTLVSLFWSGNIVLGRFVAGHIPPATLSWIRWVGAFAIFLPFAWPYVRRDWKIIKGNFGFLTLISSIGISLYTVLAYYSLQYTEAINALLIASTGPLLVAIATYVLYGEKPTPRQVLGVLASLTGVVVVVSRGSLETLLHLQLNPGDVWWFVGQIIYALYTALLRKRPPAIHSFSFALVLFGWGGLMLTPLLVAEIAAGYYPVWDMPAIASLGYIVLVPSLISYLFYNRGVEMIGPNRASPFYHLIPIFGSALAILFLGERPHPYHAAGYALVLVGIIVATANAKPLKTSAVSPAGPAVMPAPSRAPRTERRRRPRSRR